MKSSSIQLKVIAGTLGILTVSQGHRLAAQTPLGESGTPLGESGTPLSESGTPLGESGTPLSESGTPLGQEGIPIGEGAVPLAGQGRPVGEGATPVAEGGTPLTEEGTPVGKGGIRLDEEGIPLAEEGTPVAEGGTPLAEVGTPAAEGGIPLAQEGSPLAHQGIPLADYGTPSEQMQEQRRRNRETAMKDPKTAGFFGGDAATRRQNASKNLVSAVNAKPIEESVSQENADDREWSRGAQDSARSRPEGLFSKDWWEKHQDILPADAQYYKTKAAYAWWGGVPWSDIVTALGMQDLTAPFKYSSDRNLVFKNDMVYVNRRPVSSYDDYVQSARELAQPIPQQAGKSQGWYPLGTFAISSDPKTKVATHAIQLAMDNLGNIAGVCVNWPEGQALPVRGSVDPISKRAAFSIGGVNTALVDTGIANLTEPYTRVWAHLSNSHSQTWLLTRLRDAE